MAVRSARFRNQTWPRKYKKTHKIHIQTNRSITDYSRRWNQRQRFNMCFYRFNLEETWGKNWALHITTSDFIL